MISAISPRNQSFSRARPMTNGPVPVFLPSTDSGPNAISPFTRISHCFPSKLLSRRTACFSETGVLLLLPSSLAPQEVTSELRPGSLRRLFFQSGNASGGSLLLSPGSSRNWTNAFSAAGFLKSPQPTRPPCPEPPGQACTTMNIVYGPSPRRKGRLDFKYPPQTPCQLLR